MGLIRPPLIGFLKVEMVRVGLRKTPPALISDKLLRRVKFLSRDDSINRVNQMSNDCSSAATACGLGDSNMSSIKCQEIQSKIEKSVNSIKSS